MRSFPEAEIFLPADEPVLRWGVLAPGWIAGHFVDAVSRHTRQRIVTVGSRSIERAEAFATAHGIGSARGSYEEVVADPEVDVVYIAAPQSEHLALGLLAISGGKHVLIEKPLATSAADARTLVDAARAAGVFLMEAMWSRYQPQSSVIRTLVADGALGEIHSVAADHGQAIPRDPTHRLYRPELGGGALLDLGIYPIQLDSMVLGTPGKVTAIGALTDTGVDAYSTVVLAHGAGQSTLTTSILTSTPTRAVIEGAVGRLEMGRLFHAPTTLTFATNDFFGERTTWTDETGLALLDALSWQATALASYVGDGRLESPLHDHAETVAILETIDEARRQLGITV